MAKQAKSGVIYRGASLIDGSPIVVIAIQTEANKGNRKTGAVLQTYILRSDMDPQRANKTGADYAICGNCRHRGTPTKDRNRKTAVGRSCYVFLGQGPLNVYRTFKRGRYPDMCGHKPTMELGRGRVVRLGTYGDPAAVPAWIWLSLLEQASRHMAYSHQADVPGAAFEPAFMMRSADTAQEAQVAWSQGERTFRVLRQGEQPIAGKEINCPSLRGVHCQDCGLCGGAAVKAKSITIPAHGAGAGNFV